MPQDLSATGKQHSWSWPLSDWDQMWKPSMWLRKPPQPHDAHLIHITAILVLAGYANIISNEVLADIWHIPFQLGILGLALLVARRAGTTWTSMGLRPDRIRRGLIVGGTVIGVIAIGVIIAIAAATFIPDLRDLFEREDIVNGSIGWVLFQALIRIPLATALYEEVLFRGIVFGMFARRYSPLVAAVVTSLLFGFWHILPTLDMSPIGDTGTYFGLTTTIIGSVAGTAIGGLGFLLVRLYANSTYASVLAHIGTNSVAMLGALFVIHVL
jgi:membrane protease YdiL (CAAX protease family)